MPKVKAGPTPAEMFRHLSESLKLQANRPNIFGYQPYEKQVPFHASEQKGRLFIGGNRTGKTTCGVVEDIYWARGSHPYRKIPDGPIRGRVVGVDYNNGLQKILLPEFARWCPPSLLKNGSWEDSYSKELRVLTFENGSFIEFMSYDQDTDKFAGTSRHFVHYDEEPPQDIYTECGARLVDTNGDWWMTMTPVEGMTWVYEDIYQPGKEGKGNIFVTEADMADNPYLDPEAIETFLSGLGEDERKARESGTFVQLGGLVFKGFRDESPFIIPAQIPPKDWAWYSSTDDGWTNPTAVLWHAVSPEGRVITFGEHYAAEMTIAEHAQVMHEKEAAWGKVPEMRTGDPAMKQTTAQSGVNKIFTYAEHGIYIGVEGVPRDVEIGIQKMQQYLRVGADGLPTWQITEDCVNLIREMKQLRRPRYVDKRRRTENNAQEGIHKKNDHAPDSARYFFTFMPNLAPDAPPAADPSLPRPPQRYDEALAAMALPDERSTKWNTYRGTDTYALEYD